MSGVAQNQGSVNLSGLDQGDGRKKDLVLHASTVFHALFLELSAILLAGYLFVTLGKSWTLLQAFNEYLWLVGAVAGGIIGLYVVLVLYKPAIVQR
jgi:hypothetical protein